MKNSLLIVCILVMKMKNVLIISIVDHQIEITRITLSRRKNCSHEKKKIHRIFLLFFLFRGSWKVPKEEKKNLPITKKRKTNKNSLTISSKKEQIETLDTTNKQSIVLVNQIHVCLHSHALAWLRLRWMWCIGVDKWFPFGDDGDVETRPFVPSPEFVRM